MDPTFKATRDTRLGPFQLLLPSLLQDGQVLKNTGSALRSGCLTVKKFAMATHIGSSEVEKVGERAIVAFVTIVIFNGRQILNPALSDWTATLAHMTHDTRHFAF